MRNDGEIEAARGFERASLSAPARRKVNNCHTYATNNVSRKANGCHTYDRHKTLVIVTVHSEKSVFDSIQMERNMIVVTI